MTKVRAYKDVLGAVVLAATVISLYSIWGAHMLGGSGEAAVATAEQNLR